MLLFLLVFPLLAPHGAGSARVIFPEDMLIGDVPVGRMSLASAREAVTARANDLARRPTSIVIGESAWAPLPADLGVTYDVEATLAAAVAVTGDASSFRQAIPIAISFDPARFDAWVDAALDDIGGHARDASVVLDGTTVTVVPAADGLAVDRESLAARLVDQVAALAPVDIAVQARSGEARISTAEAETARDRIEALFAEPIVLAAGESTWTLAPEDVAPALRVVSLDGETLDLTWDAVTLDEVIATVAADIDRSTSDAWVQDLGTKSWLVPAEQARTVDRPGLVLVMQAALRDGRHRVEVPVILGDGPEVETAELMAEMGMTDVVGTGTSIYAGSGPGRAHNVETAAYLVDGTLVPPGEVFSFNAAVGSLFNGMFMDAGSYIDGPSGQSLAGGVCQVSTTIFRAALDAGFPIEEWWQHTYRSPFYELGGWSAGFDASIVQDSEKPWDSTDFRFRNPTDSWLMISARVTPEGELRVEIHGADPGYAVEISDPVVEVAEWASGEVSVVVDEQLAPGTVEEQPAMDGLRVTVYRTVYDHTGAIVLQDTFVSTYQPYGAIVRLSPDMADTVAGAP